MPRDSEFIFPDAAARARAVLTTPSNPDAADARRARMVRRAIFGDALQRDAVRHIMAVSYGLGPQHVVVGLEDSMPTPEERGMVVQTELVLLDLATQRLTTGASMAELALRWHQLELRYFESMTWCIDRLVVAFLFPGGERDGLGRVLPTAVTRPATAAELAHLGAFFFRPMRDELPWMQVALDGLEERSYSEPWGPRRES